MQQTVTKGMRKNNKTRVLLLERLGELDLCGKLKPKDKADTDETEVSNS